MTVTYDAVHSTNIRALGYAGGVGYVEFNGGRRFAYRMDRPLFDQMKADRSIGGFFAKNVKGKCEVVWNGHCCDNSPCMSDATKQVTSRSPSFVLCDVCAKDPRFGQLEFVPYAAALK